mgnify:FL=1
MASKSKKARAKKQGTVASPQKKDKRGGSLPTSEHTRRWSINLRLLAITALVVLVLGGSLYAWSTFQVQRQATALLKLAEEQNEQGKPKDAVTSYRRYIALRPDDAIAFAEFAKLYANQDSTPIDTRIQRCEEAIGRLRQDPDAGKDLTVDLHVATAELLYRQGQQWQRADSFDKAITHLRSAIGIQSTQPVPPRTHQLIVLCGLKKHEVAKPDAQSEMLLAKSVDEAYKAAPNDNEICLAFARLQRDGKLRDSVGKAAELRKRSAETTMLTLTTDNSNDPFAWLAAFLFYMDTAEHNKARPCIEEAARLVEHDADQDPVDREFVIWSRAGLFAFANNDVASALRYFEKSIQVSPKNVDEIESFDDQVILHHAYTNYAALLYRQRDIDKAVAVLNDSRDALKQLGFRAELLLTEILTDVGRHEEAWEPLGRLQAKYGSDTDITAFGLPTRELDAISAELLRVEAHLLQQEGRYYEAIETWDRYVIALGTAVATAEIAEKKVNAHLNAADCHVVLQDFDAAAQQIGRADEAYPENSRVAAYFGMLAERQGQIGTAYNYYAQALQRKPVFYPAREGFARVVLSLTKRSGIQPNWRELEEQFPDDESLPPAEREKWALFRAEAAITQKDYDRAATLLRDAKARNPKSTQIVEALALNAFLAGNEQRAHDFAQELNEISQQRFHVLQFEFNARRQDNEAAEQELIKAIGLAEGREKQNLERILGNFEMTRLGRPKQGRERLASLLGEPSLADLPEYRRLVELAIASNELDEAERYLNKVQQLEGAEGVTARYLKARLALRGGDLAGAKREFEILRGERDRWSPLKLLEALIAEEEGRPADAVVAYQDAVRYGDKNPAIASRIFELLSELNRYADAEEFLAKISADGRALGWLKSIQSREFGQAVAFAKAELDADRTSLRNWLRYGSALVFAGQLDEAEQVFLQALDLDATNPQALIQLVGCHITKYRESGEEEALNGAREALQRFMRDADAKPETLSFLAAQCHQLLGEFDEADEQYRRALRISGNKDITIIRTAAPFFAGRDRKFAIELLEQAKDLDPEANDITRLLAVLYSEAGTLDDWERAYEVLVEESGDGVSLDDRRLLALMKLRTGDSDAQYEARQLMEEVIAESVRQSPADQQLLAEIYEKTGDLEGALERMRELVEAPNPTIDARQYHVQLLIKAKELDEAEERLNAMRAAKSVPLGFLIYSYCDIARSRGEPDRIDGIILEFIDPELKKHPDNRVLQAQIMLAAADLAETFGRDTAAENWHKSRLQLLPQTFTSYAVWLAQKQRIPEAMDLALEHAKPEDVSSMIGLLTTLTIAGAPADQMDRARSVIQRGINECSEEVDFLIALATLRQIQRETREAITLYERALQRSGQTSITALNNLALLLAEMDGRGDEALRHIDRAINARGTDNTALLDTKASVLIALERYDDALRILQRILLRVDDKPVYYLHLAECQYQTGERDAAEKSFENALELGIDNAVLTALDTEMLTKLRAEFETAQEATND